MTVSVSPLASSLDASEGFSAPFWIRSPHLQTVWGRLVRSRQLVPLRREVIETPDGDEMILDHLDGDGAARIFILHGLEGSSNSVYVQGLLALVRARGERATVLNFRSCARDPRNLRTMIPNRKPRFYHSGDTADFDFVVRTLAARAPEERRVAFGGSLGGNVLLKWLGEHPDQGLLERAAAASVPYDLGAGARQLDASSLGRFYVGTFLRSLREKARQVVERFPATGTSLDLERVMRSRTFVEFDDAATAPLHGFAGADDYYTRSSSLAFLGAIRTPTLCLSAADDPFLPAEALDRARRSCSQHIRFRITAHGGHLGFVGGSPLQPHYWAEQAVVAELLR
ncbi:MAG TPA: alpha/beta fold hydrolase [Thermoanaerobaculia bacterium]|nr:alpha/beta fold hydrolase [Thermoanaerobaculia bacterium]